MVGLTTCPHCGKVLANSSQDLSAKDLALLRLIVEMEKPEVEIRALAGTLGRSTEGSFDRRLADLRKLGLIDRRNRHMGDRDRQKSRLRPTSRKPGNLKVRRPLLDADL
jgi:predicted transcriptional regulator